LAVKPNKFIAPPAVKPMEAEKCKVNYIIAL
jgi:hypothetical protein